MLEGAGIVSTARAYRALVGSKLLALSFWLQLALARTWLLIVVEVVQQGHHVDVLGVQVGPKPCGKSVTITSKQQT
jgi:hypothetical protein